MILRNTTFGLVVFMTVILFLLPDRVISQKQRLKNDIIYLKDGSKFVGILTDHVSGDYATIQLSGGEEITVLYDKILRVKDSRRRSQYFDGKQKGYFHESLIGVLAGKENDFSSNAVYFSFYTVNGYQFHRFLKTGIGIGWDYQNYKVRVVPVFFNVSGEIGKRIIAPVYFFNIGKGFAFERKYEENDFFDEDVSGGLMIHTGIGLKVRLTKGNLLFHVGHKSQNATVTQRFTDWQGRDSGSRQTERVFRKITVSVGYAF